jgi:putative GTP pyrophosphokinase
VKIDPKALEQFLTDYQSYIHAVLNPTRTEMKDLFKSWKEPNHWARYAPRTRLPAPSPVQRAFPRIKRPESVVDKILRKRQDFPDGVTIVSINRMYDAVAGRIIVYFLSNLPLIDREIRESGLLELHPTDTPIAYLSQDLTERLGLTHMRRVSKDSGYASLHYIVRMVNSGVEFEKRPWFEIQVRTLAEDLWGEIEHILGYKPEKKTSFAVRKQFQIIGSELSAIDEHFNLLYEELARFQVEVNYSDHNPLNAENLPPLLDELGVGCAQREIDGLLKVLFSRGFTTVADLRKGCTPKKLEIVRNTCRRLQGRDPSSFEIIAGIAAVKDIEDEPEMVNAVKAQTDFLNVWMEMKKDLT